MDLRLGRGGHFLLQQKFNPTQSKAQPIILLSVLVERFDLEIEISVQTHHPGGCFLLEIVINLDAPDTEQRHSVNLKFSFSSKSLGKMLHFFNEWRLKNISPSLSFIFS